jgi:hypothetical protein
MDSARYSIYRYDVDVVRSLKTQLHTEESTTHAMTDRLFCDIRSLQKVVPSLLP